MIILRLWAFFLFILVNLCLPFVVQSQLVRDYAAGYTFSAFVLQDGSVWSWGVDEDDNIGADSRAAVGVNKRASKPRKLVDSGVTQIAFVSESRCRKFSSAGEGRGEKHNAVAMYLKEDGTLMNIGNRHRPHFEVDKDVTKIAAGPGVGLYVKRDGSLWRWKSNYYRADQSDKKRLASNVVEVATSGEHTVYIKKDGSLWGWGDNFNGELGGKSHPYYVNEESAVKIVPKGVVHVSVSQGATVFVKDDGSLWGMGGGTDIRPKSSNWTRKARPVKLIDSGIVRAYTNGRTTYAITASGDYWACGRSLVSGWTNEFVKWDDSFESIDFSIFSPRDPYEQDHGHFIYEERGFLYSSGNNENFQLGNGTNKKSSSRVRINVPPVIVLPDGQSDWANIQIIENTSSIEIPVYDDSFMNLHYSEGKAYTIIGGSDRESFTVRKTKSQRNMILEFDNPPNFEEKKTYELKVRAFDGMLSDEQKIVIRILDDNDPPAFSDPRVEIPMSVAENFTGDLLELDASDEDGDEISFSLHSGANKKDFKIENGVLRLTKAANYEKTKYLRVTVKASSRGIPFDLDALQSFVFKVKDKNDAPFVTTSGEVGVRNLVVHIDENELLVDQTLAVDEDGNVLRLWIVGGDDAEKFEIKRNKLSFKATDIPDFEKEKDSDSDGTYSVVVRVSDGKQEDEQEILVKVRNVNDRPEMTGGGAGGFISVNINENETVATTLKMVDQDTDDDEFTYSLSGGHDQWAFAVDSQTGVLSFKYAPDFETRKDRSSSGLDEDNVYEVKVRGKDTGGLWDEQLVKVQVVDQNDPPSVEPSNAVPSINGITSFTTSENQTLVGTFEASDSDSSDSHTFSVSGGEDKDLFEFKGAGNLHFRQVQDFESGSGPFKVTVRAIDQSGASSEDLEVEVSITDANEAPKLIDPGTLFAWENFSRVGTLKAEDPEKDSIYFEVLEGSDGKLFSVDRKSGILSFRLPPDFESLQGQNKDNLYELTVRVSDRETGGLYSDHSLKVEVRDVEGEGYLQMNSFLFGQEDFAFTTHNGSASFTNWGTRGGEKTGNGEAIPYEAGESYVVDIYQENSVEGYMVMRIPQVDSDRNGVIDFLEVNHAVDAKVQSRIVNYDGKDLETEIHFEREAGEIFGNHESDLLGKGGWLAYGFPVTFKSIDGDLYEFGELNPEQLKLADSKKLSQFSVTRTEDGLTLNPMTVKDEEGEPNLLNSSPAELVLSPNGFRAELAFADSKFIESLGPKTPSFRDYSDWTLTLLDSPDVDEDGRPDLEDDVIPGRSDPPAFLSLANLSKYPLPENETEVMVFQASDRNGDALAYTISGGWDAKKFRMDPKTGKLSLAKPMDYENLPSSIKDNGYEISVKVTDETGLFSEVKVKFIPQNVNEAPVFESGAGAESIRIEIPEMQTKLYKVVATDPEGEEVVFKVAAGGDSDLFTGAGSDLVFKSSPDFENPRDANGDNRYELILQAEDASGNLSEQEVEVVVKNVPLEAKFVCRSFSIGKSGDGYFFSTWQAGGDPRGTGSSDEERYGNDEITPHPIQAGKFLSYLNYYYKDKLDEVQVGFKGEAVFDLPQTDSNQNGLIDLLEKEIAANEVEGSFVWKVSGEQDVQYKVIFNRAAHSHSGTCTIVQEEAGINFETKWELEETTVCELNRMSPSTLIFSWNHPGLEDSKTNFEGSGNSLTIDNFSLLDNLLQIEQLKLRNGVYGGNFTLKNGKLASTITSWKEFKDWRLLIRDDADADGDGIPDLSDPDAGFDQDAPSIRLLGEKKMEVSLGATWVEPGFVGSDETEMDLTDRVLVEGNVNTEMVGHYRLTYSLHDSYGNEAQEMTRMVSVVASKPVDKTPPVLFVYGDRQIDHLLGEVWTEPGFAASDDIDGDLSKAVVVTGKVDIEKAGDYLLSYSVSDQARNKSKTEKRTVRVYSPKPKDLEPPVITLLGEREMILFEGTAWSEPGATAKDNFDGDLTGAIEITGKIDQVLKVGSYLRKYNVSDEAGNQAIELKRSVVVKPVVPKDVVPPVIVLKGKQSIELFQGSSWTDPGVMAYDNFDGDLTAYVQVTGKVNLGLAGTYQLKYNAKDKAENSAEEITREVVVKSIEVIDRSPPQLVLKGLREVSLEVGSLWSDPWVTATDDQDGDLSKSVKRKDSFDASKPGTYLLTYHVKDSSGNAATELTRTVIVFTPKPVDLTGPVITLLGKSRITIDLGSNWVDPGAKAIDNLDGDVTDDIVKRGEVESDVVGTYRIRYGVSDSSGNAAEEVIRKIEVLEPVIVDSEPPVLTLVGERSVTLEKGEDWNDPGAKAFDNFDGDLSDSVVTTGEVNTKAANTYVLKYNLVDSSENRAVEITRTIIVTEPVQKPIEEEETVRPSVSHKVIPAIGGASIVWENPSGSTSYTLRLSTVDRELFFGGHARGEALVRYEDFQLTGAESLTAKFYEYSDLTGGFIRSFRETKIELSLIEPKVDSDPPSLVLRGYNPMKIKVNDSWSEPGFYAYDEIDGLLTESVSASGEVNPKVSGSYRITYSVSDRKGNRKEVTRKVVVEEVVVSDTEAPKVTLLGSEEMEWEETVSWEDPGVRAYDNEDGDLSEQVVITGLPDVNVPGNYLIRYNLKDKSGNSSPEVTRLVKVLAQKKAIDERQPNPVDFEVVGFDGGIRMEWKNPNESLYVLSLAKGDRQLLFGGHGSDFATVAYDSYGINGEDLVTGTFHLYSVSGSFIKDFKSFELDLSKYQFVKIDETTPILSLKGSREIFLKVGDEWTDPGVYAFDPEDGDLTSLVVVEGFANTGKAGSYTIWYSVSDQAKNSATPLARKVYVEEDIQEELFFTQEYTIEAQDKAILLEWTEGSNPVAPQFRFQDQSVLGKLVTANSSSLDYQRNRLVGSEIIELKFDQVSGDGKVLKSTQWEKVDLSAYLYVHPAPPTQTFEVEYNASKDFENLRISWTNPPDHQYALTLLYGKETVLSEGFASDLTLVSLTDHALLNSSVLQGRFTKHTLGGSLVGTNDWFNLDFSSLSFGSRTLEDSQKRQVDFSTTAIPGAFVLRWSNPNDTHLSLRIMDGDRLLFAGGHQRESAEVRLLDYSLKGSESMRGRFTEYSSSGNYLSEFDWFDLDLSNWDFSGVAPVAEPAVVSFSVEPNDRGLKLSWTKPNDAQYGLELKNPVGDRLIYGGHYPDSAFIDYDGFSLSGSEILSGRFLRYQLDGQFSESYGWFEIDLSQYELTKSEDSDQSSQVDYKIVASDDGVTLHWTNQENSSFILSLYDQERRIIWGGHLSTSAEINFERQALTGVEELDGQFFEYGNDGFLIKQYGAFALDLSEHPLVENHTELGGTGGNIEFRIVPDSKGIRLKWSNPAQSNFGLRLMNGGKVLFYGGHEAESALVDFDEHGLNGKENLRAQFSEWSNADGRFMREFDWFEIDLIDFDSPPDVDIPFLDQPEALPNEYTLNDLLSEADSDTEEAVSIFPFSEVIQPSSLLVTFSKNHATLSWSNPKPNNLSLELYSGTETLYYGGHYTGHADVSYESFGLAGNELLSGSFTEYGAEGKWVKDLEPFSLSLGLCKVGDEKVDFQWSETMNGNHYELVVKKGNEVVLPSSHSSGAASFAYQTAGIKGGAELKVYFRLLSDTGSEIGQSEEFAVMIPDGVLPPPVEKHGVVAITLLGNAREQVSLGSAWIDPGATAYSEYGGSLPVEAIDVSGFVDTSRVGSYSLAYNAVDTLGNSAEEVIRLIVVVDDELVYRNALKSAGRDLGYGWREADWFGVYFPTTSGWNYHTEHGWIYPVGNSLDSIWYWDSTLGWCWTNQSVYPFIYNYNISAWVHYMRESKDPRLFYDYAKRAWFSP
jgi:alpha-tubulin suppressor-like RCC1 family protein